MNYEEKYNQAIEAAKRELRCCGSLDCDAAKQIFRLFPELRESEDEKIRKEIIQSIQDNMCVIHKDKCIAWLEKQGEHAKFRESIQVGDKVTRNEAGDLVNLSQLKQEIESYKESIKGLEPHSDFRRGQLTAYNQIMQFIDSLPEENHFDDNSEMVSDDLDIVATSIIKRLGGMEKDDCVSEHELKIFKAAVDWQKQKDQETIKLAEDHAMLAGMNKMKEEMMKDAVETTIVNDWQYGKDPDHAIIPAIHQRIEGFNVGDKVKIIIVKEEQ